MQRRVFSIGFRACLAAIALLLAIPAIAQLPTTITISDPRGDVDELLRRGQQFEQQRRWGEALAHYEDAVRAGGATVMVRVRGDGPKAGVAAALQEHGGHFLNYYGRFATEEISRWQGVEPAINEVMRR